MSPVSRASALGAPLLMLAFVVLIGLVAAPTAVRAQSLESTGCYADTPPLLNTGYFDFASGGNSCSAPTLGGGSDRWDTTAYIGLSFSIGGDGVKPHFDAGVRETNVNANNQVYGGEANFSLSLVDWLNDAQLRLLALGGTTTVLGNAGVGWDFGKHSFLLNAGAQVPHVRGFVDFTVDDKTMRAFLEINSYGQIEAVQHTLTCGAGTVIENASQILNDWGNLIGASNITGDIFSGSLYTYGSTGTFGGTPSPNFSNGLTCFTLGVAPS